MNDNTIIRIKVPARLYESVKAKLMIKENLEAPVKEEETLEESPLLDAGLVASGMAAIGASAVLVDKFWDYVKKKNPEAYKKAQALSGAIDQKAGGNRPGQGHGVDASQTFGPNENTLSEAKKAEDKKKAEEKKKKEAEAKKVADKKAAEKKKAEEKKK